MKTVKRLIITVVILLGCVLFTVLYPWITLFFGILFSPTPKPEITYGEFPITLTYEYNGELKTIEDTVICEFDGFGFNEAHGKFRKWETYLKSGNVDLVILDLRGSDAKDKYGNKILCFFFSFGNAEYYMGDTWRKSYPQIRDYVEYKYEREDGTTGGSAYTADEALNKFGIKLISFENAQPIENKF